MTNRLTLSGQLVRLDPPRRSPAGLPIVRFVLEHRSRQQEAGYPREARLRISAVAAGDLTARLANAALGQQLTASGFLSRASTRSGDYRLVLHAEQIDTTSVSVS